MYVLNSLMPVFLLIALGKTLTCMPFFDGTLSRTLNRLTYWIALPALLLDKITNATFSSGEVARIPILLVLATCGSILFSYIVAALMKLERRALGAFVQGSSRANNAFVGLPVILYALGGQHPGIETAATVALAPAIVFYNVFSVSVLLAHRERGRQSAGEAALLFLKQIITNPLLISCALGLTLHALHIRFPMAIQRSLSALGSAALALALLSIGSALSFKGAGEGLPRSFTASVIKIFIQPLIGLGLALLWNLPPVERQMLLIYLACPTAVASYIMADLLDSDRDLAAHIIVISTLLSAISLSLIVAFGG